MTTLNVGDYKTVVQEKDGKYFLYVVELGMLVAGTDIATAYRELDERKRAYFAEMEEAGYMDRIPTPSGGTQDTQRKWIGVGVTDFLSKLVIVVVAMVALAVPVVMGIQSELKSASKEIQSTLRIKGGRAFYQRLEDELAEAADPSNDIPLERQQRIVKNLRAIVARVKPFTDEISPLFGEDECACRGSNRK